jgi:hypothetical protein
MINVCSQISCPFANTDPTPPQSSGCTRYSISNHCHLMLHELGLRTALEANQYWLSAKEESVNTIQIKRCNDDFLASDESSQRRLEWEVKEPC